MSGGAVCRNPEHRAGGHWLVIDREANHSAFNGYHWTPSKYSAVRCFECRAIWRTTAKYVATLEDAPKGWESR